MLSQTLNSARWRTCIGSSSSQRTPCLSTVGARKVRPFTSATELLPRDARHDSRSSVVTFAKKGKKGGGAPKDQEAPAAAPASADKDVDLDQMYKKAEKDTDQRMQKCVDNVQNNFSIIRTGRANPKILDKVMVSYYGAPTPLNAVASISVPDASTLRVAPFDKSALKDIERGLLEADLGLNPNNDGETIRLNFPPMTEDRRKELAKQVGKMGEEGKVAVRNVRKDVMKKVVDRYDFPKDQKKDLETSIQKITDTYVKRLDEMAKAKTEEIMKI